MTIVGVGTVLENVKTDGQNFLRKKCDDNEKRIEFKRRGVVLGSVLLKDRTIKSKKWRVSGKKF